MDRRVALDAVLDRGQQIDWRLGIASGQSAERIQRPLDERLLGVAEHGDANAALVVSNQERSDRGFDLGVAQIISHRLLHS